MYKTSAQELKARKSLSYSPRTEPQCTTIEKAIQGFLLSCKVEGKANGTIDCYSKKLKGFLWYAKASGWPEDVSLITTQQLREFLAYLRDTDHRFESDSPRAQKPVNSTTIQKYYRAISCLFSWLINEEILSANPLLKIKVPRAEKKVIKGLSAADVNALVNTFGDTFEGIRNRAIILVLVDCGLRLRELLGLKLGDIDLNQQLFKVDGKTGERVVRFGSTTKQALMEYIDSRSAVNGHTNRLWKSPWKLIALSQA